MLLRDHHQMRVSHRVLREDEGGERNRLRALGYRYARTDMDWLGELWARPPAYAWWLRTCNTARHRFYYVIGWLEDHYLLHCKGDDGGLRELRQIRLGPDFGARMRLHERYAQRMKVEYDRGRSDGFDAGYEQGKRTQVALLNAEAEAYFESKRLLQDGLEGPVVFTVVDSWPWHQRYEPGVIE